MKQQLSLLILGSTTAALLSEPGVSKHASGPQAQEIVKHAELMQELKWLENRKPKEIPQAHQEKAPHLYTQSEIYMYKMFDDYYSVTSPEYIKWYLNNFMTCVGVHEKEWETYRPILMEMLENEKHYLSDYVFYHAYKKELGLIFDLYKELFDLLTISAGSDQTILMRDIMKPRVANILMIHGWVVGMIQKTP